MWRVAPQNGFPWLLGSRSLLGGGEAVVFPGRGERQVGTRWWLPQSSGPGFLARPGRGEKGAGMLPAQGAKANSPTPTAAAEGGKGTVGAR